MFSEHSTTGNSKMFHAASDGSCQNFLHLPFLPKYPTSIHPSLILNTVSIILYQDLTSFYHSHFLYQQSYVFGLDGLFFRKD